MSSTLTLSYGDPSPDVRDQLGLSLVRTLALYPTTIYCDRFTGTGSWSDTDTGETYTEHSGVILADVTDLTPADLKELEARVTVLARHYGQDAIGYGLATDARLV